MIMSFALARLLYFNMQEHFMRPLLDIKDAADVISAPLMAAFHRIHLQSSASISASDDISEGSRRRTLNFGCLYIVNFELKGEKAVPRQFIPLFRLEKSEYRADAEMPGQYPDRRVEMSSTPQYFSDPMAAIELLTEYGSIVFTHKSPPDAIDADISATVLSLKYCFRAFHLIRLFLRSF